MNPIFKSTDGMIELRLGDWREVLADVDADTWLSDPPYSAGVHEDHRTTGNDGSERREIDYAALSPEDVHEITAHWASRVSDWFVAMSCNELSSVWRESLKAQHLAAFYPVPAILRGMTVRRTGDGPSSWTIYINVARTKAARKWGTLDGAYVGVPSRGKYARIGGKPLWLMRALVRDYSKPGSLIVDPFTGGGTTLLAAAMEGRRSIGAEIDPKVYAQAVKRLSSGFIPSLLGD